MITHKIFPFLIALLATSCDDRFIKQEVSEIRVHDKKMMMDYTVTNAASIQAVRDFLNQPDTWTFRVPRPALSFIEADFFDSSTNRILTLHGTGVDLWCGRAHRGLTEAESLQFFAAIEWQARYKEMKEQSAQPAGGAYVSPAAGDPSAHP